MECKQFKTNKVNRNKIDKTRMPCTISTSKKINLLPLPEPRTQWMCKVSKVLAGHHRQWDYECCMTWTLLQSSNSGTTSSFKFLRTTKYSRIGEQWQVSCTPVQQIGHSSYDHNNIGKKFSIATMYHGSNMWRTVRIEDTSVSCW